MRDNAGRIEQIERRITIPKNIVGQRLSVFVSSGASLSRYEVQVSRDKFVPHNFDDIFRILSERRKTQNLYIQVRAMDNGLIVEGQEMLGVPPSVMNVMNTRASGGVMQRLRDRKVLEEHIATDYVIVGALVIAFAGIIPFTGPWIVLAVLLFGLGGVLRAVLWRFHVVRTSDQGFGAATT